MNKSKISLLLKLTKIYTNNLNINISCVITENYESQKRHQSKNINTHILLSLIFVKKMHVIGMGKS